MALIKKVLQNQNGLMYGNYNKLMNKTGFTLIEVLVAIVLIGILAAVVVPNLYHRVPSYERKQFIAQLNELMLTAWQNAIITHKIHKVDVDFGKQKIQLFIARDGEKRKKELEFEPLTGLALDTSIALPENIEIKNFYIEGFDEMARFAAGTGGAWFFIVPEGLSQEVTINFVDTKDTINGKLRPTGLVLNPFTAQFKIYDSFQK